MAVISRTLDRITAASPAAEGYCKNRIYNFFETSDGRNLAVSIAAGIAAGIFAGCPNDAVKYAALAVMVITWAQSALLAGFLRQWLFVFFAALYFMLPYVFIIAPDTAEAAQATEFQFFLSDLMLAVPVRPMRIIAGEGDPQLISIIMLLAYMVLFFVGFRIRSAAKRSDFYCRTRLEQLK